MLHPTPNRKRVMSAKTIKKGDITIKETSIKKDLALVMSLGVLVVMLSFLILPLVFT